MQIKDCGIWDLRGIDHDDSAELRDRVIVWHGENYPSSKNSFPITNCKPYLFPLSSMSEEVRKEFNATLEQIANGHAVVMTYESFDCLNKHHIDYRGLIPKGLANDATELNIY